MSGLPEEPLRTKTEIVVTVSYKNPLSSAAIEWYLDGVMLGKGGTITIDPAPLTPGKHSLRVVALKTGSIKTQGFLRKEFTVAAK